MATVATVDGTAPVLQDDVQDQDKKRKIALVVVFATVLFAAPHTAIQLLPGLAIGAIVWALIDGRQTRWAWIALTVCLAMVVVPRLLNAGGLWKTAPVRRGGSVGNNPVGYTPRSGEEVLLSDGSFVRVADPAKKGSKDITATQGWQQRLLTDLTDSLQRGQEQVLIVFSRQGCPWCERQLPVLQRAIAKRAGGVGSEDEPADAPVAGAAFVGGTAAVGLQGAPGGTGSLLFAPLRVFVFDANEFPQMMQAFRVEAFPTSIAWGSPGVTPVQAQGYLDDDTLAEVLKQVALSKPEPIQPEGKKKKGLFR